MLFTRNYRGFRRNMNYKLVIIILCIFIVSLLNLKFIFVNAINYENNNISENTSYHKQNINYEMNLEFLLNPNSDDYKYYFDKYITNVYIKRKMDLYIQENGNEIFVYYKSKLDKITE